MENPTLSIAENTKLPICATVSAILSLVFEFCVIYVSSGKLMFFFHSPLQFGRSVSAIDMIQSIILIAIPTSMAILIPLYARKKLLLLAMPIIIYLFRLIVKTGYLSLYEGRLSFKESWLDLLVFTVMLLVFGLTVLGKIPGGWWLTGACALFIVMEFLKLLLPVIMDTPAHISTTYLSTFLSPTFFFMGYGILGISLDPAAPEKKCEKNF